jgi:hypothetical protein
MEELQHVKFLVVNSKEIIEKKRQNNAVWFTAAESF